MNKYLATTALEEFWDTSKSILFLGEWCLIHGRKSFWKNLDGVKLDTPHLSTVGAYNIYKYISNIFEEILPSLCQILNQYHNCKFSQRYWKILIGPWLRKYLFILYARYIYLIDSESAWKYQEEETFRILFLLKQPNVQKNH